METIVKRLAPIKLSNGNEHPVILGHTWQNGGTFVMVPPGKLRHSQVSREAEDQAPVEDLLEVLNS